MKRTLCLLFAAIMSLALAACGGDGNTNASAMSVSNKSIEMETTNDSNEGLYENGMYVTSVYENNKLNMTGSAGPVKYIVKGIRIAKATAADDDTAEYLEVEKKKEFALVSLTMYFENTSDESVCFVVSQSSVFTNTEKDIPANGVLSDLMNEEVPPHESWEGTEYYVLKETDADNIKTLNFALFPPVDEEGNDLSEDVEINIALADLK